MEASELDAIKANDAEAVKDCYLEALAEGVSPKPNGGYIVSQCVCTRAYLCACIYVCMW